ncbi:uncharacterized protein BJ171DRAFT_516746 [Polychytrium aggregatum]|uniref:uncharacterized protein n=1 Tax=Polychytrium aggregatum TaxID=110093 RepID=UPI0022FEF120|nr:uncharacterized protein BJ171DRAFT_516746 [Polychytrium aggregatum]KAI9201862.1 hypothetical protein BJ171DRAFT_516746 [Polychytrium aggregatum]
MVSVNFASLVAAAALAVSGVQAHVTCNPNVAPNAGYFVTDIRVPHSFPGSNTINITVKIPDGVTSVKPQLIAGWKIDLAMRPLNPPIVSDGTTINTTVDTITWYGGVLSNDYYADFGINMKLPNVTEGSKLYFPATQITTNSTGINVPLAWAAIPDANGTFPAGADSAHPAPSITLWTGGVAPAPSPSTSAKSGAIQIAGTFVASVATVASLFAMVF